MSYLDSLPFKRTRRALLDASKPPAVVWMRGAMRLGVAGLIWLAGFPHIATIFVVLAIISVLGAIELQVARVFLTSMDNLKGLLRTSKA